MTAATPLKTKTAAALGDLLRLARAGKLHGLAYAIVKEDVDGSLSGGSNVIWNGDSAVKEALDQVVEAMLERMAPKTKSKLILPN
jgi:ribose 1,5-bisphosphokinase PhnN